MSKKREKKREIERRKRGGEIERQLETPSGLVVGELPYKSLLSKQMREKAANSIDK